MSATPAELVEQAVTAHETHWALAAATLRAIDTDEDAGHFLRRHVRECMGAALIAGYEGDGACGPMPALQAHHQAQAWVGAWLLRDLGPRGLSEIDWTALGHRMTAMAGVRIKDRRAAA